MYHPNLWKSSIIALALSASLAIWGNVDWQKGEKHSPEQDQLTAQQVAKKAERSEKKERVDSRHSNVKIYGWLGASVSLKLGSGEDDRCWEFKFSSNN